MAARITQMTVEGFRCLDGFSVEFDQLTALIGANGAGKSSLLRALQFVFGQVDLDPDDCTDAEASRDVRVELRIAGLPDSSVEQLRPWLNASKELVIARNRVMSEDGTVKQSWTVPRAQCPGFAEVRDALGRGALVAELSAVWAAADALVGGVLGKWTTKRAASERLDEFEAKNPELRTVVRTDSSLRFGSGGAHDLSAALELLVLPAMRDASADADDGKGSTLGRLVDLTVRAGMGLDDRLAALTEKTAAEYDAIIREASGTRLEDLAGDITAQLGAFAPGASVRLAWADARRPALVAPPVRAQIVESGHAADIGRQGHGVQRAYVFSLLRALLEARRVERADRPGLLLAIEEPEAYQHPLRAQYVSRVLSRLASDGAAGTQVIFTTHSPYLVSVDSLTTIRSLRMTPVENDEHGRARVEGRAHDNDEHLPLDLSGSLTDESEEVMDIDLIGSVPPLAEGAEAATVDEAGPLRTRATAPSLREIAERLEVARRGVGKKPWTSERVAAQLPGLMGVGVSEGFFANAVALVEGFEDVGILQGVADGLGIDLAEHGVALIAVNGKAQLPLAMEAFRSAGVPVYVIFDTDEDGTDPGALHLNTMIATLSSGEGEARPGTRVEARHASVSPDLRHVLALEVGAELLNDKSRKLATTMGLPANTEKNGHLARAVVAELRAGGHTAPTLAAIVSTLRDLGDGSR